MQKICKQKYEHQRLEGQVSKEACQGCKEFGKTMKEFVRGLDVSHDTQNVSQMTDQIEGLVLLPYIRYIYH